MDDGTVRETGSAASRSGRAPAQVGAAFRNNYLHFQYEFVEFFTEHLADLSKTFRGDLQLVLVLAVVGQLHLRGLMNDQRTAAGISASRLADVTGVPRETVRRKLESLEKLGLVERSSP